MSDVVDASNALVAAVSFYAKALGEERAARQQAEQFLRQLTVKREVENDAAERLERAVENWVDHLNEEGTPRDALGLPLRGVLDALIAYHHDLGRVEPAPTREGSVRAAPAPGDADVPRPDR